MPLEKFSIFLNNPASTYAPGQDVTGGVVLNSGWSDMDTQGLVLEFKGTVSVNWTEHRTEYQGTGSERRSVQVPIQFHESYYVLNYTSYLLGDGHGTMKLAPGETVFPFTFPINAMNAPGTFHGEFGKVEYKLKATLKRRGLFADYHTERDVHVTPMLDLNQDPILAQPREWHTSKNFCCFCCASGPLTLLVKLGATGFCVGESIPLLVEVNNASTRKVKNVTAELIQEFVYRANGGKKQTSRSVAMRTSGQEVGPGDSEVWRGNLIIPNSTVPTRLGGGCSIIDVTYYLKVVAQVSGAAINLSLGLPVTIGTVPIRTLGFDEYAQQMPVAPAPIPSAPPPYVPNEYPLPAGAPPPNYPPPYPTTDVPVYDSTTKLVV